MNHQHLTSKAKALIETIIRMHNTESQETELDIKSMADGVLMLWESMTEEHKSEPWRKEAHKDLLIARYGEKEAAFFLSIQY
ncbi:hypothetical protein [Desulfogranum japonicum]|uniref:hypothetical protein n=1 Tax=Desulfogranum japonicum TaxID=231447 RepID=UPI00040A5317|nr:hypothetical protein [Desulfogranum japonicum]